MRDCGAMLFRSSLPSKDLGRQERITAVIEARFRDANLTVNHIAAASAISRSELYRLFEPHGGVMHYINQRRLCRLHHALRQPGERRTFHAIAKACGFKDAGHASRRFKTMYGIQPIRFRQLPRDANIQAPDAAEPRDQLTKHTRQSRGYCAVEEIEATDAALFRETLPR